jgi:hypothetical protein
MIQRFLPYKSIRSIVLLVTTLVLIISSITGCTNTSHVVSSNITSTAASGISSTAPLTTTSVVTTTSHLEELLGLVPSANYWSVPVFITLIDYAAMFDDYNISFNTTTELLAKISSDKFLKTAVGEGSYISGFSPWAEKTRIQTNLLGYDVTHIDAEVQFGWSMYENTVAIGKFDPEATENALTNQSGWPSWVVSEYKIQEYNGIMIHSWGNGQEPHEMSRYKPPHLDNVGRARPLAVTNNYLFSSYSLPSLKLNIDVSNNKYDSLADTPKYSSIAKALVELKVYASVIADGQYAVGVPGFVGHAGMTPIERSDETPLLKKFLTIGSGFGNDEKGTYWAVVLYHDNAESAIENVSLLKQRVENTGLVYADKMWSEFITSTDIRADGNILIAKLYTTTPAWSQYLLMEETLLAYEQ